MLTKKQFCEAIVREQMLNLGIEDREKASGYIFQSSCLAAALDLLGELEEIDLDYAQGRAGILWSHIMMDENHLPVGTRFLTVREIYDLLPEQLEDETEGLWEKD